MGCLRTGMPISIHDLTLSDAGSGLGMVTATGLRLFAVGVGPSKEIAQQVTITDLCQADGVCCGADESQVPLYKSLGDGYQSDEVRVPLPRLPSDGFQQSGRVPAFRYQAADLGRTSLSSRGGSGTYEAILKYLESKLSKINASLVVDTACRRCKLNPRIVEQKHIPDLVETMKPSLALYLDGREREADEVVGELLASFGFERTRREPEVFSSKIETEYDIGAASRKALEIARKIGFSNSDPSQIATIVSELTRNCFNYAGSGEIKIEELVGIRPGIMITVSDEGPGIPHLEEVLSGNYNSKTGLALGIAGSMRLTRNLFSPRSSFIIDTEAGVGTTIVVRLFERE